MYVMQVRQYNLYSSCSLCLWTSDQLRSQAVSGLQRGGASWREGKSFCLSVSCRGGRFGHWSWL